MLTARQTFLMAVFGAILWFAAALLMRAIEPLGAFEGAGVLVLYAAIIPGTVPFILLARKVAALRRDQTALAVTIATGVASMLDGNALVLIPHLYGTDVAGAGAAILWGGGVGLILGVIMSRAETA